MCLRIPSFVLLYEYLAIVAAMHVRIRERKEGLCVLQEEKLRE